MPDPTASSDKSTDSGKPKRHDAFIAVPASVVGAAVVAAFTHFMPVTSEQPAQPDLSKNADFVRVESRVQELGGDLIKNTSDDAKVEGQIVKKLDSIETKLDRLIDRLLEKP